VFQWLVWDDGFRPAAAAARADQMGIDAALSPWWGGDPSRPAAGFDLSLGGEIGDFDFVRARLGLDAVLPLPADARLDLSARGGVASENAPPQRLWILGGPASLRGFAPGVAAGPAFLSGRIELRRPLSIWRWTGAVDLALFADGGWAGERGGVRWTDALASAGAGLSLLDGVLRVDAARSWKGPRASRVDVYFGGRR
jgi:hemolysin activation/secretion protein